MHYEAEAPSLPHNPLKAIVAPRPIGWISAMDRAGRVNLAPYSFFNAVGGEPDMVMFSSSGRKDAMTFAEEGGEFVCSLATFDLREAVNATSAPLARGTSEFGFAGLTPRPRAGSARPVSRNRPRRSSASGSRRCRWCRWAAVNRRISW